MPRKRQLTWQPGSNGRNGRWRKKYKGRIYYFASGTSKSDKDGYLQALDAWQKKKDEIDGVEASRPKPHQQDYEKALEEWKRALEWSQLNGDMTTAGQAQEKISALEQRLAKKSPTPLGHWDWLLNQGIPPPELFAQLPQDFSFNGFLTIKPSGNPQPPAPDQVDDARLLGPDSKGGRAVVMDGDPFGLSKNEIRREVWKDRLRIQGERHKDVQTTVSGAVENFLTLKRNQVKAQQLSTGRYDSLRVQLSRFEKWIGSNTPITAVGQESTLENYYNHLLNEVHSSKITADYANDLLNSMKQFVQRLWERRQIAELPRTLRSPDFRIGKATGSPEVFTDGEIQSLLDKAVGRPRLYVLLMLNCGMTQKDISDLKQGEVDWSDGAVTRKRSKTRKHEKVPTVRHLLWRETFDLLRQYRSADPERALVNAKGQPLKTEQLTEAGKLKKCDNIQSAYRRLCTKAKITKPVKLLRKTSASLLFTNERFRALRGLFLGHAPADVADKNYTAVPPQL